MNPHIEGTLLEKILTEIKKNIDELKSELKKTNNELKNTNNELKSELKKTNNELKRNNAELKSELKRTNEQFDALRKEVETLKLSTKSELEANNQNNNNNQTINEGQTFCWMTRKRELALKEYKFIPKPGRTPTQGPTTSISSNHSKFNNITTTFRSGMEEILFGFISDPNATWEVFLDDYSNFLDVLFKVFIEN